MVAALLIASTAHSQIKPPCENAVRLDGSEAEGVPCSGLLISLSQAKDCLECREVIIPTLTLKLDGEKAKVKILKKAIDDLNTQIDLLGKLDSPSQSQIKSYVLGGSIGLVVGLMAGALTSAYVLSR